MQSHMHLLCAVPTANPAHPSSPPSPSIPSRHTAVTTAFVPRGASRCQPPCMKSHRHLRCQPPTHACGVNRPTSPSIHSAHPAHPSHPDIQRCLPPLFRGKLAGMLRVCGMIMSRRCNFNLLLKLLFRPCLQLVDHRFRKWQLPLPLVPGAVVSREIARFP